MLMFMLKELLNQHQIKYRVIRHSPAYTAPEIAHSAHVAGKDFAKTVIVKLDGKMAMVVLSANQRVDLTQVKHAAGVHDAQVATEKDFQKSFPKDCEIGAMPPFGNLFGMQVFIDKLLAKDEEITFNAGTHSELVKLAFKDFTGLVKPKVLPD